MGMSYIFPGNVWFSLISLMFLSDLTMILGVRIEEKGKNDYLITLFEK